MQNRRMRRYLESFVESDLRKKMVVLTGPRQVGKTTLAKALAQKAETSIYLNQDEPADARAIRDRAWPRGTGLVILDEIHKAKGWKASLKGAWDTREEGQRFLVTGSARLDTFRQSGDSLAGRYFQLRLHPLSVRELAGMMGPVEALEAICRFGGFPEPLLSGSEEEAARWRRQYYDGLLREDILDFGRVHELRAIRTLLELLRTRVGSPLSYASLAGDLQIAPNTVKKYVGILEALHVIFLVRPFHRNVARSILKEPKAYFYDSGFVATEGGARLENSVAAALLKRAQFLQDTQGKDCGLHYLRTKDGREVDFAFSDGVALESLIEVKTSAQVPSQHLYHFKRLFPSARAVQLTRDLRRDEEREGVLNARAAEWLAALEA